CNTNKKVQTSKTQPTTSHNTGRFFNYSTNYHHHHRHEQIRFRPCGLLPWSL
ncbi:hypothetical protein L9F63_015499, partial [Diploptera punctata]